MLVVYASVQNFIFQGDGGSLFNKNFYMYMLLIYLYV